MKLKYVNSSPSTRSRVTKCQDTSSTTLVEPEVLCVVRRCITQGLMSDQRFRCYTKDERALMVAQRTCDKGFLDYISNRETVRTMMKDQSISQRHLRYQGQRFEEWTRPGTQVYLSKAKLRVLQRIPRSIYM